MAKASTTSKHAGSPESVARRKETAAFNSSLTIDFSAGKAQDELQAQRAATRGVWGEKLAALMAAVESGQAEAGKLYPIGKFGNASGARTVIRGFEKDPSKLPGSFLMEAVASTEDGVKVSTLWAGVPADEEASTEASE